MKIKIPFAVLYEDLFSLMDTTNPPQLTLRGIYAVHGPDYGGNGITIR